MVDIDKEPVPPISRKRADARRNEATLLEASGAAFIASGVDAPVREIAAGAGVGIGTVYRHFPTRADLIVAVYRHEVEACAEAGPTLVWRPAAHRIQPWRSGSTRNAVGPGPA